MSSYKIYEYANCSTCKKALKFLESKKVKFEQVPIVEKPPSQAELKAMLQHLGGDFKKLFNTSGLLYREMGLSDKIKKMTADEAIKLLAQHGKLIKRPFLLGTKIGLVGFKETEWKKL